MTDDVSTTDGVSRRRLLATLGAGAGAAAFAGCGYRPGGGDIRWTVRTGSGLYRPDLVLAVGDALVTVRRSERRFDWETNTWGDAGTATAYDGRSGGERWATTHPPLGRPAAHDDALYVGHERGALLAFGADGTERWRTRIGAFPRSVAATADRVYAVTPSGGLTAFETGDGDELWNRAVDASERYAVAASDEAVFVVTDGGSGSLTVTAIARDGTQRWSRRRPGRVQSADAPVVHGETLYLATDRRLLALAVDDGTRRWSQPGGPARGAPVVSNESVYYAAGETLFALGTGDGEERWTYGSGALDGIASPPAVAGDAVYVGSDGELSALAAADGSVRWQVSSGSVADAQVIGESVVAATEGGTLRAHWRE